MLGTSCAHSTKASLYKHSVKMTQWFCFLKSNWHYDVKTDKSVMTYHRCNELTMSLQFLAQKQLRGSPFTGQRSPAPQRQTASITGSTWKIRFLLSTEESCDGDTTLWKVKLKSAVFACFLECGLWCSAQLNCTLLAPPCSKIGFERELIAGLDHTAAAHKTRHWSHEKTRIWIWH